MMHDAGFGGSEEDIGTHWESSAAAADVVGDGVEEADKKVESCCWPPPGLLGKSYCRCTASGHPHWTSASSPG